MGLVKVPRLDADKHNVAKRGALAALLWMLIYPAAAPGATSIGQLDTGTPSSSCLGTSYWAQNTSAGPSYTVPADGVITIWRHKANSATGRELGLRIFRLVSGTNYVLAGTSGVQVVAPVTINTFHTRIPVKAGDRLGLYVGNPGTGIIDPGGGASCAFTGGVGDLIHEGSANPELQVGATANLLVPYANIYRLNVTASIEPDADGDGYGDETQDGCTTNASAQGECPAPTAPDKRAPKGRWLKSKDSIRDNSVSVKVLADEPVTATVAGTVSVPNTTSLRRLARTTATLKQNKWTKLKIGIPKKSRRPIKRALKRHRKLAAKLTVTLKDAAGNVTRLKPAVSLRP
jgi:hypothetical protein